MMTEFLFLGELSLLISLEKIHTSLEWHEGE